MIYDIKGKYDMSSVFTHSVLSQNGIYKDSSYIIFQLIFAVYIFKRKAVTHNIFDIKGIHQTILY
jgi:hypothetical protein